MFTAWKNGPEDNSLEGRKKRLVTEGKIGDALNKATARQRAAAEKAVDVHLGINPDEGRARTPKYGETNQDLANRVQKALGKKVEITADPNHPEAGPLQPPEGRLQLTPNADLSGVELPTSDLPYGLVNQSKYVDGAGSASSGYITGRGGGETKYLNENAVLELLYAAIEQGIDPSSIQAQAIAEETHARVPTKSNKRRNKNSSAMKTAALLLDRIGDGFKPGDFLYGKKGGQNTNIPDDMRTNLSEDIMDLYENAMGLLYGEQKPKSRQYKRTGVPTQGDLDDKVKQNRQQVQNFHHGNGGYGGSTSNLADGYQNADIYMVRKELQEQIMDELREAAGTYSQTLTPGLPPTPMDGEILANAFINILSKYQKSNDLLGVSLKELKHTLPGILAEHNSSREDFHKVLDVDFTEEPNMNIGLGEIPAGDKVGRTETTYDEPVIGMDAARHLGAKGIISAINNLDDGDATIPIEFFSGNKRWDGYKVEPTGANAKLGEYNMGAFKKLFTDLGLDELGTNIPSMNITGDRLSNLYNKNTGEWKPAAQRMMQQMEGFTPDMKKYWMEFIKHFQENAPENMRFPAEQFTYRDNQYEDPSEWIGDMIEDAMIKPGEEGEMLLDRDGAKFHQFESRAYLSNILQNLQVMNMMAEAQNRDPKGLNKLMAKIIYGAQNKNYAEQDDEREEIARSLGIPEDSGQHFWPRLQVYN